jgi:hypothetical protein
MSLLFSFTISENRSDTFEKLQYSLEHAIHRKTFPGAALTKKKKKKRCVD